MGQCGKYATLDHEETNNRRMTRVKIDGLETSLKCNDLAARIAGRVLIVHASEGAVCKVKWRSGNWKVLN